MRPVTLSTEVIDAAFDTLLARQGKVTGPQLQQLLRGTYGHVGSTTRINRRLRERRREHELLERDRQLQAQTQQLLQLQADLLAKDQALNAMRERAELAEERERSHQNKWAYEIYDLRQEVKALKVERAKSGVNADRYLDMHREVMAARVRIDTLEKALRERTRSDGLSTGEGKHPNPESPQ